MFGLKRFYKLPMEFFNVDNSESVYSPRFSEAGFAGGGSGGWYWQGRLN